MRKLKVAGVLYPFLTVVLLSACAEPTVKYKIIETQEDRDGHIKFYVASSDITLMKKPADSKDKDKEMLRSLSRVLDISCENDTDCFQDVQALVTPKEFKEGKLYAIEPEDNLWSTTRLSVSYVSGTHLIKQLGTDVVDHRKEIIEAAGAIGSVAAKAAIAEAKPKGAKQLHVPAVIDVDKAIKQNVWQKLDEATNGNWWYRLVANQQNLPGSINRETFFSAYAKESTHVFAFSPCREAELFFVHAENQPNIEPSKAPVHFRLTIIDPSSLETIKLPTKGVIKMHELCGADVETQADNVASTASLIKELMNQVKAVKDSQNESKQK